MGACIILEPLESVVCVPGWVGGELVVGNPGQPGATSAPLQFLGEGVCDLGGMSCRSRISLCERFRGRLMNIALVPIHPGESGREGCGRVLEIYGIPWGGGDHAAECAAGEGERV